VAFTDGLGNGQPQTRMPLCSGAGFITPVKALKEMGQIFRGHPHPLLSHCYGRTRSPGCYGKSPSLEAKKWLKLQKNCKKMVFLLADTASLSQVCNSSAILLLDDY